MDVTSYLLGKKAGGGGQTINNQNKDITINQNGTTSVSADAGYTGLGTVGITTNVTPDLETKSVTITENGTTTITPTTGKDGISEVEVTTNVSGGGDLSEYFASTTYRNPSEENSIPKQLIKKVPSFQIPYNYTSLSYAFYQCRNLKEVELFDTSNITSMANMFSECSELISVPQFNTQNVTNMANMFNTCTNLTTVPLFNTSKVTTFINMFKFSPGLNDTTLDNVLQMCINAISYSGVKTLATLLGSDGVSHYPASRIQALPHYQDFINAGWTIGYN